MQRVIRKFHQTSLDTKQYRLSKRCTYIIFLQFDFYRVYNQFSYVMTPHFKRKLFAVHVQKGTGAQRSSLGTTPLFFTKETFRSTYMNHKSMRLLGVVTRNIGFTFKGVRRITTAGKQCSISFSVHFV